MPRSARRRLFGRTRRDDAEPELFRAQRDVDVYVVDPRVREDPHRVALVELVPLHDGPPVALGALEKQELMNAHLSRYVREECERQLDHRMEADESADSRIHLLDRNRRVPAPE